MSGKKLINTGGFFFVYSSFIVITLCLLLKNYIVSLTDLPIY